MTDREKIASLLREEELNWRMISNLHNWRNSSTSDRITVPIITRSHNLFNYRVIRVRIRNSHPMVGRIAVRNYFLIERLKELGLFL